jgi:PAS domain S-box-containing protein
MSIPTFTLLIVEDLPANREVYRQSLMTDRNCTYDLLEAESVREGLELYQTRSIDAILLDYGLPDGDGLQFLEALSALNTSIPPVVMLTGQGNESIAVRAMKLGAQDYLVKGNFTPQLLISTMRSAIENARLGLQLRQREDMLHQANQRITNIWEGMSDAYVTLDRDWRIVYTNPAATQVIEQLVGLAPAEFLGKTHWEVFPWSVDNSIEREYRQAVTDRVAAHLEVLYEPTSTWFEIHAYPSSEGLGLYFRDINERKWLEAERIASEQERDRFFNLSIDLLAIANFDGYFIRLNPAWEKTFGFTSAELMERPFIDFVHPDDRQSTIVEIQSLTTGESVISFENRYRCKDGSYRWLMWNAMPYVEHNILYAIGHDITDSKQAQAALEARNQELDSFVYIVSHDLKAPLRAIANLSVWIEEDLAGSLEASTQQQIVLLRSRVHSMEATIAGLLDYARVGTIDTKIELVEMTALLAEVIDSLAPPPTFTISIAPNLPTLYANRLLLSQVFANLIGNAIVHHDRSDGAIQVSAHSRGDLYEFAVSDDGSGIAPEYHDKIFRIFQAMNPQNRSDSSGIGLSIVKKIVEAQGGTIWLESQLGRGTTFYFTLPHRE